MASNAVAACYTFAWHTFSKCSVLPPVRFLPCWLCFGGCLSSSLHKVCPHAARFPAAAGPAASAGITLSAKQVERGTQLAAEQGLTNVKFRVSCWPSLQELCG